MTYVPYDAQQLTGYGTGQPDMEPDNRIHNQTTGYVTADGDLRMLYTENKDIY